MKKNWAQNLIKFEGISERIAVATFSIDGKENRSLEICLVQILLRPMRQIKKKANAFTSGYQTRYKI